VGVALVVLTLHDAEIEKRIDFDEAIADRGWRKIQHTAAIYCATIKEDSSNSDVLRFVEHAVDEAAGDCGISHWEGVCFLSDSPLVAGSISDALEA
jgi:hypothetical protein